jgi:hypothetical protein
MGKKTYQLKYVCIDEALLIVDKTEKRVTPFQSMNHADKNKIIEIKIVFFQNLCIKE